MEINLAKHKWYPMIHPTLLESRASDIWNAYVLELEKCKNVEEIQTIQKIFKDGMINIALDQQCEHIL